jgi:phospholipid transport system substrate-binding protein
MRLKIFVLTLFFLSAFVGPAGAGTAREAVEAGTNAVLGLLNDPAFRDPATHAAQREKIEAEVLGLFDFEEFSSRAVGPPWRKFTPDQKARFQTAFTDWMRNSYIDTLDSYNGERVEFTGEISSDNGTRVEVRMNFLAADKTYAVAFRLLTKNGRWVVYDFIGEGLSMIRFFRDQCKDILLKGDPEGLISWMEARAREQLEQREIPGLS